MIFIIFIILWILFADSIWCFVIPIVSIMLRASYRERNVKLFKIAPIVFATFLFFANYYLTDKPLNENLLLSLRIIVFSGLLLHMFDSATKGSLKAMSKLEYLIYSGIRIMAIVEERLSDTWLIFKIRWNKTKLTKKPSLVAFTFVNFIVESTLINKQIQLVNYEKGGLAIKKNINYSYSDKKAFQINLFNNRKIVLAYSTLGDISLLIIILITPTFINLNTIPNKFTNILEYIVSVF